MLLLLHRLGLAVCGLRACVSCALIMLIVHADPLDHLRHLHHAFGRTLVEDLIGMVALCPNETTWEGRC